MSYCRHQITTPKEIKQSRLTLEIINAKIEKLFEQRQSACDPIDRKLELLYAMKKSIINPTEKRP